MLVQSVLEIEKKEYVEQYIEHTLPSNKLNNKVNNKSVIYAKAPDFVESNPVSYTHLDVYKRQVTLLSRIA